MANSLVKTPVSRFLNNQHYGDRPLQIPYRSSLLLQSRYPNRLSHSSFRQPFVKHGSPQTRVKTGSTPAKFSAKKCRRPSGLKPIKPPKNSTAALNMAYVAESSVCSNLSVSSKLDASRTVKNNAVTSITYKTMKTSSYSIESSSVRTKNLPTQSVKPVNKSRIPVSIEYAKRLRILALEREIEDLMGKVKQKQDEKASEVASLKQVVSQRKKYTARPRGRSIAPAQPRKQVASPSESRDISAMGTPVLMDFSPAELLSRSKKKTAENFFNTYRRGYTNLSTPSSTVKIESSSDHVSENVFHQLSSLFHV